MNILVTGGCGLIGSNLVPVLRKTGHKVIVVDLKEPADYVLDISKDSLDIIAEDIDVIYHLAAQPFGKGSEIDPFLDLDYNIKGTLNVCYLAKQKKVNRIIYTSTMAVYGNNDFASEDSPLSPLSNYAVSKLCGEFYIKKFANEVGFSYIILRLWNTYGPGQDITNEYKGVVSAFANQVLRSNHIKVTGSLDRYRDIVYVVDAVKALTLSIDFVVSDIYNVSTGKKTTIRELIETIIKADGKQAQDFIVEDVGGHAGDQHGCVGDNTKLVSRGWEPTVHLVEGITNFLTYIKNQSNEK